MSVALVVQRIFAKCMHLNISHLAPFPCKQSPITLHIIIVQPSEYVATGYFGRGKLG